METKATHKIMRFFQLGWNFEGKTGEVVKNDD